MEHMTTRIDYRKTEQNVPFSVKAVTFTKFSDGMAFHATGTDSDHLLLTWVKSGILEVKFHQEIYELRQNDLFWHLPGEDHDSTGRSIGEFYELVLDGPLALAFFLSYRFPRVIHAAQRPPAEIFQRLSETLCRNDCNVQRYAVAAFAEILARAAEIPAENETNLIDRFKRIVQKRYGEYSLNVASICEELNCSRVTLYRVVRKELSRSPVDYLMSERCVHALAMIRGTVLPISEIGKECGIPNPATFYQFIRKYVHMSPTRYREINSDSPKKTFLPKVLKKDFCETQKDDS